MFIRKKHVKTDTKLTTSSGTDKILAEVIQGEGKHYSLRPLNLLILFGIRKITTAADETYLCTNLTAGGRTH
jgi:hypothetical protein